MNANFAETPEGETIDPRELRDALGCFATGVSVVTTRGPDGEPVGLTVNSFASVSLEPALILWSLSLAAPSLPAFRANPSFAVNIIGADAKQLALAFSRPAEDKFADVAWTQGQDGAPLLSAAVASVECRAVRRMDGGDHEICLGEVLRCRRTDGAPLLFHHGRFAGIGETV